METIKKMHPITLTAVVIVIAGVIFGVIKLTEKDDDARFAEMQALRGPAIDDRERPGNEGGGTGRDNRDVDVFSGGVEGEWRPMETGDPLCTQNPNICPESKVIKSRIARGTTEDQCCRSKTCERDFDPNIDSSYGWIGCGDQPTPTGAGSMVYNDDMSSSQKRSGGTVEDCCIYVPPTCSTFLHQGANGNDGCGTNFKTGNPAVYDVAVNEQKCNSIYTKSSSSSTGYYECEWDATTKECKKRTTTLSPAGVECSPPSSHTCVTGYSWQTGGSTSQANCTCPSSDPLKTHISNDNLWRCFA